MLEAKLYQKIDNVVKCNLCHHHCVISNYSTGICGVRQNIDDKLYSLNYGKLITQAIDPIEKKPIFHYLPGTFTYSIATLGCNLRCQNCQNWEISQYKEKANNHIIDFPGNYIEPEEVIKQALKYKCLSISYTYTEPTIFFEYALACMKLAKENNLKNIWVSNGYMTKECLDLIIPYLDAINVDLKFFDNKIYLKNCGCQLKPILDNLKYLVNNKINLEITTLLIPGLTDLNDQPRQIANFIANELNINIPWHITKFSPQISYQLQNFTKTSNQLLNQVYVQGKKEGLNYIYTGNVINDERENTYCPKCHNLIITRNGYNITINNKSDNCLKCGYKLILKYK